MLINGIVERKLLMLESALRDMKGWNIVDYAFFKSSSMQQKAVERSLTVCVEIMIDTAVRILALKKIPPHETAIGKLEQLETLSAIASSDNYKDMVRFRNLIVHRYENIDPAILFDIISNRLEDYKRFIEEIRTYCCGSN